MKIKRETLISSSLKYVPMVFEYPVIRCHPHAFSDLDFNELVISACCASVCWTNFKALLGKLR